jgi:hypothetical protein
LDGNLSGANKQEGFKYMESSIFLFVLVGFIAQIIDGSLGMAYGVSANSFL